jgi:hypothetical protein
VSYCRVFSEGALRRAPSRSPGEHNRLPLQIERPTSQNHACDLFWQDFTPEKGRRGRQILASFQRNRLTGDPGRRTAAAFAGEPHGQPGAIDIYSPEAGGHHGPTADHLPFGDRESGLEILDTILMGQGIWMGRIALTLNSASVCASFRSGINVQEA